MLGAVLAAARQRLPVVPEPLFLSSRSLVLELTVLPRAHSSIAGAPALLLQLRRVKRAERIQCLRSAYRLTTAESEVAAALADGFALRDIAKTRGASLSTVRSQLQTIFTKLGVQRQSELVRTLSQSDVD